MSGRKVLILVAAGAGAWWFLRNHTAAGAALSTTAPPAATPGVSIPSVAADPGPVVAELGPFYAAAKPIAKYVTTPLIDTINKTVGGATPYGPLTNVKINPDGTATGTDGLGATVTLKPDGTIHRTNPSFSQTNGGKVIIAAGHELGKGAKALGHAASSAGHWIEGLF